MGNKPTNTHIPTTQSVDTQNPNQPWETEKKKI